MPDVTYPCDICELEHRTEGAAVLCCISAAVDNFNEAAEARNAAKAEIPLPKAAELLGRAAKHMHDRASTYDKPEGERSMGQAVAAFNTVTGHTLKESEGWLFMALLKAVRGFTREAYHADSFEDLIAYAALCAEARGEGR